MMNKALPIKVTFCKPWPVICKIERRQVGELWRAGAEDEGPQPFYAFVPTAVATVLPVMWQWVDPDKTCECCGENTYALDHYFSFN
jgi:hypothetical protein